jgi:hypothetical protein
VGEGMTAVGSFFFYMLEPKYPVWTLVFFYIGIAAEVFGRCLREVDIKVYFFFYMLV